MEIGWISAIMESRNSGALNDDAIILLPAEPEQIIKYERRHPDAIIIDLQDNNKCFPTILQSYQCTILDILSLVCSLRELNSFLAAIYPLDSEQFEIGLCSLLNVKKQRPGGTLCREDMIEQIRLWEKMRYTPISENLFIRVMDAILPNCTQEELQIWIAFVHDCVEQGQYVDFEPIMDKTAAVERWLEAFLAGFYISKMMCGEAATEQVSALALLPQPVCLYPGEILPAASFLEMGPVLFLQ